MNQDLEDLLAGRPGTPGQPAPYVFVGVVRELGAAAMPGVPVTDNTARVTVEEVLRSSGTLDDYTGRDITVQLSSPAEVGQRLIFFTRGWLYGQSVAVVEVARADVSERDVSDLRERIADVDTRGAEQAMQERVAAADLIVGGRVLDIRPAPLEERAYPISEHEPDWWEAIVAVDSVEKSTLDSDTVRVLFPRSTDELWIDSPKFVPGQEGIWLLRRDQQERGAATMRVSGALTALDPLDFQPRERLEQIRPLLRGDEPPTP
jgi:hypothetical protein